MTYLNSVNRTVLNMFSKYGGVGTIIVEGAGTYDVPSSTYITPPDTTHPVRVLLMDFTNKKDGLGEIRDTLIQEGDKRCLVLPPERQGNLQQPQIQPNKDFIQIGNLKYKIISFKDLNTSGVYSYMYEMYIRGA